MNLNKKGLDKTPNKFRVAELFAGTGSFSIAFKETQQAQTVFANDFIDSSKKLYDANHNPKLTLADIHDLKPEEMPDFDILTAGFPCQPFSLAGNKMGFDDQRSDVFWKMIEIIKSKRPVCILLENVKNLVSHDKGNTFSIIQKSINDIGYSFDYKIINTSELTNIPQNRERVYMVCFSNVKMSKRFKWPVSDLKIETCVADFLSQDVPDRYYYNEKSSIWDKLTESAIEEGIVYQYRRVYVRANKSGVCPTLTSNMGTGGHNIPIVRDSKGIRKLTPDECFRLQGFPDDYCKKVNLSNSALYKLAGNAISVGVVRKLASAVIECLLSKAEIESISEPRDELTKLSVVKLKNMCREKKLRGWSNLKKEELIEFIIISMY